MKIWVDDIRPAPDGYVWTKSVDEFRECIEFLERQYQNRDHFFCDRSQFAVELIDLDHDAGD